MKKRIMDCVIFNDYINREYKITTKHKIFGNSKISGPICDLIDDDKTIGVVVHGTKLFCHKNDGEYIFIDGNENVIIADGLMEIFICI